MERNTNVIFNFFDQALVQRVIDFTELSEDAKTKESINTLKEEIKKIYEAKDAELSVDVYNKEINKAMYLCVYLKDIF